MKHKWKVSLGITLLTLLIAIGLFCAYFNWAWNSSFEQTEIKQGFTPELLEALKNQYGITIPEEAQFIKGYNCPGWQDSFVTILFECPINQTYEMGDHVSGHVKQLLKLGTRYSGVSKDTLQFVGDDWYEDLGGQMEWMLDDNSLDYTYISYNIESDKLVIRFVGWRPGATFP